MPDNIPTMSPKEFRTALDELGFAGSTGHPGAAASDEGLSAVARFFHRHPRIGQTWGKDGPPPYVVLVLRLMRALKLDRDAVLALLDRQAKKKR